jgi:hypothetical protein
MRLFLWTIGVIFIAVGLLVLGVDAGLLGREYVLPLR